MPFNPSSATRLADFGSGIGTAGATITIDTANAAVGIATTLPLGTLQVGSGITMYGSSGIVSATSFFGRNGFFPVLSATDLTVNNIVGAALTLSGNLTVNGNFTVNGTQTIVNSTSLNIVDKVVGIASLSNPTDTTADGAGIEIYGATSKTFTYNNTKKAFEANIPIATNELRILTGAEKSQIVDGNTVNLVYSSANGNIAICTNPTANITVNLTGIPTSSDFDGHAITVAIVVNSTGTARTCTAVNLNGVSKIIKWTGGSLSNAVTGVTTTNGYAIYNFTGINTVGSASTTANYEVFGTIVGGYF